MGINIHTQPHMELQFELPKRLFSNSDPNRLLLKMVDCHAGGEPARIVFSGVPPFPASCSTALLKRKYMMDNLDYIRKVLLLEPRGYPCQNVDFVFASPSNTNLQYVIGEQNKIYPLMSGHNTIATATAVLECGLVQMDEPTTAFTLESPAGPIQIVADCERGKAKSITLINTASFVEVLDLTIDIPHGGIGKVTLDIAYGGMWYAVVDLKQFENHPTLDMTFDKSNGSTLARVGEMIKVACREQHPVFHPTEDYPGVDILVFRNANKNTVPMSNTDLDWEKPATWTSMLDRSPCGTGTCAVMATMHARGELKVGEEFVHESIVGSTFVGKILEEVMLEDGRVAIVNSIKGSACITQYCEVVVDENDPFEEGYKVSDIW